MKDDFIEKYALYAENYASIQSELMIDKQTFYKMIEDFADEINIARKARQICIRKGISPEKYKDFYLWFKTTERKCHYCGTKEKDIEFYFNHLETINKRPTRGKTLEIDRLNPLITDYGNIYNLRLSCYICNNAKSDFFTEEQFKFIGVEIGKTIRDVVIRKQNG